MKELLSLFVSFFKIGIMTFGGGYAMLPMLEREIVNKHGWASAEELIDYFAIGQCTPGVIAVNTATFIGYKRKKVLGGIFATLGVIAPSIIIISLLAGVIDMVSDNIYIKRAFAGISIAVSALIIQSVFKMAKSAVKNVFTAIIAIVSFILSVMFSISPIIIVILSGISACIYKGILEKNEDNSEKEDK